MSDELVGDDVRRRAAVVGVPLDELRVLSVVQLASPVHAALPAAIADAAFEDEPASFEAALARGVRR